MDKCSNCHQGEGLPVPDSVIRMLDHAQVLYPQLKKRRGQWGTVGAVLSAVLAPDGLDLRSGSAERGASQGSAQHRLGSDERMHEWNKHEWAASHIAAALPF